MDHPYHDLPPRAFWRSGVAGADRAAGPELYHPGIRLTRDTAIATFGSCFAQHIGGQLRGAGCTVLDAEPVPRAIPAAVARRFGYGQFSARCGNIYSTRQMLDLLLETAGGTVDPGCVWPLGARWADAFRPSVEPMGLDSPAEVLAQRAQHLARLAAMLRRTEVLILTLGLTEVWVDRHSARAFPVCPGVTAGIFDPARHQLVTLTFAQVLADLHAILETLQHFRPAMKLLLTVSPVPLTATATGQHVLTATTAAKATLRAAAGEFAALPDVDYVPSYDLLTHPALGNWFAPNQRTVTPAGVARAMQMFLAAHGLGGAVPEAAQVACPGPADDPFCDEALLGAFAGQGVPP